MPTSKAIQRLDDRLASVPPGTIRAEALEAAKRFKTTWIDLGRVLWTVWKDRAFREWGYLTFEAYCTKEVGVRGPTAKKLLYSYSFLEREEPVVLQRIQEHPPATLPHYEAVNALRLLKQRPVVPPARYQEVRAQVLEQGREPLDVRRGIRQLLDAVQQDPEQARAARRQAAIRRMLGTLKSLRVELSAGHLVPERLLTQLDDLAEKLEAAL
ncbi:MAG: hypothetical protein HY600_04315 [Candidatus Omnitrophica bacterium]|nr:hypothetical protein [Candidatus Omnitrophota bacterium]